MKRIVRSLTTATWGYAPALLLITFFFLPLLLWMGNTSRQMSSKVDIEVLYLSVIGKTIILSSLAAFFAVLLATSVAFLNAFSSTHVRHALNILMMIPLLVGFLARNYAWLGLLRFLSGSGDAANLHHIISSALLYDRRGVVLVMATVFIPFSYFIVLQGFGPLRPAMFEASRTLGASDLRSHSVITLPIIRRSVVMASGLCTVLALGYFVTPRMIGGGQHDFIGNTVLTLLNGLGDSAGASLLALYLLGTATLPMTLLAWYSVRRRALLLSDQE